MRCLPVVYSDTNHPLESQVGTVDDVGRAVPEAAAVDVHHHRQGCYFRGVLALGGAGEEEEERVSC